ncbi:MAG TPA: YbhB/YbcL family Raf kinase inhibitor-like protein [Acidimicrobiia bacterium]|nr:YbhB/YbcL family Raf kinase inhibitor-like protein [Acidimicrobiia bacterium]
MQISTTSFENGGSIPERYALAKPHPTDRVEFAGNTNPHLEWSGAPEGTKSFALICHDYDVPSKGDDVNQADREVPDDLPRVDFFHWVLIDLPPDKTSIEEGEFCSGVAPGGKGPNCHVGRHGVNDFTGWFAGDADMAGDYYGYDGPAPPWNDSIIHHYIFTVYALDVDTVDVEGAFTGQDVRDAIDGHILDQAFLVGTYTQNPRLRDEA